MKKTIPARPLWTSVLLFLLALLARPAQASHVLGGDLSYRFIDANGPATAPLRYEISLTVYNNCNVPGIATPPTSAPIAIYERSTGARIVMTTVNYATISGGNISIPTQPLPACYTPPTIPGCTVANTTTQPYIQQKFVALVNLPNTMAGFYVAYSLNARTSDIINLDNPGGQSMEVYMTMTPPTIFNRSPIFASNSIAVICANDTTYYRNNATDADGDELEYSFGRPYNGDLPATFTLPQPVVAYATTNAYSATTPFGVGRGVVNHLNATTGIATFATPTLGKYSVAVDVKEYRVINGVRTLIGTTRRDIQLVVAACPPSAPAPQLPPPVPVAGIPTSLPRSYTIEAGTTQTIALAVSQRLVGTNPPNPLSLTATSELLDGPGGHNATLNGNAGTVSGLVGSATVTGTGSIAGNFVYTASCTEARTASYDINITLEDQGCAGKTTYDVFQITVVKPQGPTTITGDATVCGAGTSSYTASGGTTPGVTWSVTGGTIVGSNTANPVRVQWATPGMGILTLQGVSQAGCLTDPVTKNVNISSVPTLAVAGNTTICPGSSSTITVSGAPGATYTVTGGPVSGTGTTFVLTPTATTTYTITAASTTNTCAGAAQVTITVNPAVTANAGRPATICSGNSAQLGAAAVAGYTYSWSPSTGLSNFTLANPTATLTNLAGTATTYPYTLTTTNTATGCTGTATVVVTVNPAVATTATVVTTLTDVAVPIGGPAVAGYTYSWSPATGLSSATVANPTVTLPNYTGIPITRTYTLTTTSTTTGCVGTSTVVVTVNPDLTFEVFNNVITANGDKDNDRLKVRNIRSFPNNKVEIYNRWGRQIFTTTNYDNDTNYWGTDPILLAGNYYYIFKQGDTTIAKGWIEVIR